VGLDIPLDLRNNCGLRSQRRTHLPTEVAGRVAGGA
jgi:hypothetical protein